MEAGWQVGVRGGWSHMASLPCLRSFLGCLGLPFSMCCLPLKEGGSGLVTRVQCFKRVTVKAIS